MNLFLNQCFLLFLDISCRSRAYLEAFSRSAAHSAAPTALVNEKAIEANGTISRANAAIPSLNMEIVSMVGSCETSSRAGSS